MASETREKNLLLLLSTFNKGTSLSVKEIMDLCNINRASVYNYLNELNKRGYKLINTPEGKESVYSIEPEADTTEYEALTKKSFHKYLIMQQIAINGSISRKELYSLFSESNEDFEEEPKYLGLGRTRFYKMIKELLESEDISESNNGELALTGKHYPVSLYFSDADELNSLCDNLSGIPQNDPFYDQLHSILDKASFILGDNDPPENNENYLFYGCKYTEYTKSNNFLNQISKYPYRSRALKITHNTRNGERTVILAIGILIYSVEKDQLYIMGHMYDIDADRFIDDFIYNLYYSSIIRIEKTKYPNPFFLDKKFTNMYKTMFSISSEPAEDVIVEFDRVYQVENKIRTLSKNRPVSKVNISTDGLKVIYTDRISGLADFAVYLRRFGRACHIIAPESLKAFVYETRIKMLKNYEELDEE